MTTKYVVIKDNRLQMRSGHQVVVGKDPWLTDLDNIFITMSLREDTAEALISSLMRSAMNILPTFDNLICRRVEVWLEHIFVCCSKEECNLVAMVSFCSSGN
ncbi:conserved hypothetical protein [Ricinus communis]|uniref:Uncharacterized protein n=1 Tax=Ricinus communis TaxID=3988 RepID=B9T091_RICCO|nr:conserved hypothetical protein [Ricinus communis]